MKKNANAKEKPKSSFKRKEIKKEARKNLKRHYFRNILIVFLTAFIINGGYLLNTNEVQEIHIQDNTYEISGKKSNAEIILDFLSKQQNQGEGIPEPPNNYTKGVLNVLVNETTKSGSLIFGFINAFNQLYLNGRVSALATILIFSIL